MAARVRTAREIFATNLRRIRRTKHLSQEGLAHRAGLHRTYVGCLERNEKNISIESMERLAKALDVDLVELLDREKA